jgi:hypothetical protein
LFVFVKGVGLAMLAQGDQIGQLTKWQFSQPIIIFGTKYVAVLK